MGFVNIEKEIIRIKDERILLISVIKSIHNKIVFSIELYSRSDEIALSYQKLFYYDI